MKRSDGFLTGIHGGRSSTRLMTLAAFFTAASLPYFQYIANVQKVAIDFFPYFTALLTFAATLQAGKSWIEEKYNSGVKNAGNTAVDSGGASEPARQKD